LDKLGKEEAALHKDQLLKKSAAGGGQDGKFNQW